jgi:hypothetical protein
VTHPARRARSWSGGTSDDPRSHTKTREAEPCFDFVAPLTALGASHFYLFVRDRSTQRMEATIEALYGDGTAISQGTSPATGGEIA